MGTFSRLLAFLLAFVATGASVAACSSETADEESEGEEDLGGVSEDALTGGRRSLEINEDPSVLVEHPDTLVALEKKGLDLGSRLVRRLDTMSCNGCHQSRSVAGFHILGNDRLDMSVVNSLVDGMSPHTRSLVGFRKRDLESVGRSAGRTPAVPKFPFAERGESNGRPERRVWSRRRVPELDVRARSRLLRRERRRRRPLRGA